MVTNVSGSIYWAAPGKCDVLATLESHAQVREAGFCLNAMR